MPRIRDDFRRAQVAIAALFCFLGFQYVTWVSRLPRVKDELDLTATELGLLLMACGAGAAASFPLVAHLMKAIGAKRLAFASAGALLLFLPAFAAAPDYPVALVVVAADGVAVGCLNVAMNAQGAALEKIHERTAMAKMHATFSAGSLAAALLASAVQTATEEMAAHFAVAAVLLLALLAVARTGLPAEDGFRQPEKERRRRRLPSRVTLWMGCAMALGTLTEGAMNDWSTLYLEDVADAAPEIAPLGIAVVSVMMVVARLFADGWRTRWGDGPVVRLGSALAGTGLALAVLAGGVVPALLGFACVGLGVAAVTPCVYVAAAREGPDALSLVASMGTTGLLGGPAVIGFIAGGAGLAWGMGAVAASALLVSLCTTRIRWPALSNA
ncbi:MFS transporter [Streptomyces sp. CMB-StM0423]|uniref:MFS transporter n=1 Tax=Streptomyces sp. CMB-StM0423 TaxID=2059884 RepID=UPI000C6FDEC9|nr:MFS transporter [Streptomyces sp. CMB-StM0423]AUH44683.1 MFS transporter [Streptomyces sp. CMB-StM0423]